MLIRRLLLLLLLAVVDGENERRREHWWRRRMLLELLLLLLKMLLEMLLLLVVVVVVVVGVKLSLLSRPFLSHPRLHQFELGDIFAYLASLPPLAHAPKLRQYAMHRAQGRVVI